MPELTRVEQRAEQCELTAHQSRQPAQPLIETIHQLVLVIINFLVVFRHMALVAVAQNLFSGKWKESTDIAS